MISIVSRVREDYRRLFPNDSINNQRLTTLLHSVAWTIKEKENGKSTQDIRSS
jgi:hypothetical protein